MFYGKNYKPSKAIKLKKDDKLESNNFSLPEVEKPVLSRIINANDVDALRYLKKRHIDLDTAIKLGALVIPFKSSKELYNHIYNNDEFKIVSRVYAYYKKANKEINEDLADSIGSGLIKSPFSKEDIILSIKIKESLRLVGRVIFPVVVNKSMVGYVARDFLNRTKVPKVLNSVGPLSSEAVWNYDNVKRSSELVICEGVFDAINCGIDRSIALLGKNFSSSAAKINLIKRLNPSVIYIYLDYGAEIDALELAEMLSTKFSKIYIVSKKIHSFKMKPGDISELKKNNLYDGSNLPYKTIYYYKIIKALLKHKENGLSLSKAVFLCKNMHSQFKGDLKELSQKRLEYIYYLSKDKRDSLMSTLDNITKQSPPDAGDRTKDENDQFITENMYALTTYRILD